MRSGTNTPTALNQYSSRTVPAGTEIIGNVQAAATLSVDGSTNGIYRLGSYFEKALSIDNSATSKFPAIVLTATLGTTNESSTGRVFVARTPESYSYDADGNLTQDGRWSYSWDGDNRLVQILSLTNTPTESKFQFNIDYDAWGRRIQMTVSAWTNSAWNVVLKNKFLYDGWNLLAELNASNNTVIRSYLWGLDLSGSLKQAGGVGGLVAIKDPAMGAHFVSYDGNGNVTALTAAATGKLSALYEYGPFLEPIRATGPMAERNPFRASTKYTDLHTTFAYFGERYYDNDSGRWLNRDPFGMAGGLNLYGFVGNDPANFVDPDGLEAREFWNWEGMWCRAKGIGKGIMGQIKALGELAKPKSTLEVLLTDIRIANAAINYQDTWKQVNDAVYKEMERYNESTYGCLDPCEREMMQGQLAWEIMSMFIGAGEIAKLGEAAKLGEIIDSAASIGRLDGKVMTTKKFAALQSKLAKNNFSIVRNGDFYLDERYGTKAGAVFEVYKNGESRMVLRSNATEYEVRHELKHWADYNRLGKEGFSGKSVVEKEESVYRYMKNQKWLTEEEQRHADQAIKFYRDNNTIPPQW